MTISSMFATHRKRILTALLFVVVEKVAWIIEPTVFGDVIDAMIDAMGTPPVGSPVVPLLIWIGIFALNSGVGTYRRSRDERVYLSVYNDLVGGLARGVQKGTVSPERAAARAELSREVVNFFQYRIPELTEQAVDTAGAVIALAIFDWRLGAACATLLFPTLVLSRRYNARVSSFQKEIHDQQEDIFNIYATRDEKRVQAFYAGMAQWKQRVANWGAVNFGVLRLFLLGIFLVILYVAIDLDQFTTGNIYSIAAYVWTFVTSSEYLPEQLESLTSVKDISRRLQIAEG